MIPYVLRVTIVRYLRTPDRQCFCTQTQSRVLRAFSLSCACMRTFKQFGWGATGRYVGDTGSSKHLCLSLAHKHGGNATHSGWPLLFSWHGWPCRLQHTQTHSTCNGTHLGVALNTRNTSMRILARCVYDTKVHLFCFLCCMCSLLCLCCVVFFGHGCGIFSMHMLLK